MLNKIKNMKLSKSKYLYIVMTCLIIIAIGFTLAWWRWSGDINALIYGEVCAPEIVFVGGTTINGRDLLPVKTKEEGLSKDIKVNLDNTCDNDTAVLNLILKPDVFPEGLADSSFKWAVYKVTTEEVEGTPTETLTYVNDGNFSGKRQYVNDDDLISIATDLVVTENISTYRLFIWIDANMDNPSTIGDNLFKFSLYGEGKDAIYRENTIKNITMTSSSNYFLVESEELLKDNIGSIEINSFNNIPSTATEIDDKSALSNDDTVKIFYEKNPETNLNKVYIGTSNGILKMNTKMDYMFAGLTKVESLDLSRLDTSNVTSMVGVFYNSPSLTSINMNNWDTSKVQYMNSMFRGVSGLTSLDVSSFDTSKVTTMESMFYGAGTADLTIDLSNFDTPLVTTMIDMFNECKASSIILTNFSNDKLTNIQSMFRKCSNLTSLDLSTFNTSNVTTMTKGDGGGLFYNCSKLEFLDLTNFDTSKVTNFVDMFAGCSSLTSLNLSSFNTTKVTSMAGMFYNCSKLVDLDISSFNTSNVLIHQMLF